MQNPSNILVDGSKFGMDWLQIYWYGALIALGIIISCILVRHEVKRRGFHPDTMVDLCLLVVPLGAIFARLYYVVFSWSDYFNSSRTLGQSLLAVLDVRSGGLAIYGAVIGGLLGVFIYSRIRKNYFLSLSDLIMPGVALSQAIGRWGNYFNQEAYGGLVADWFPKVWPLAVKIDRCSMPCCADLADKTGNIHYATFFYESVWCFIIFLVLWFIIRKRAKHRGDITMTYLIMYGFERMLVESLRTDSLMIGRFRVSQLLSALLFVAALAFVIIRAIYEKKHNVLTMDVNRIFYDENAALAVQNKLHKSGREEDDAPEVELSFDDYADDGEAEAETETKPAPEVEAASEPDAPSAEEGEK